MGQINVRLAESDDLSVIRVLFQESAGSLGFDLGFQGFADELAALPGKYAAPRGCLLLANVDGEPAGCVALRPLEEGIAEMKRLYVRSEFRGAGLGLSLVERVLQEARERGYARVRLDTVPSIMPGAVALYGRLGFQAIPPYFENPVPGAVFLELRLDPGT